MNTLYTSASKKSFFTLHSVLMMLMSMILAVAMIGCGDSSTDTDLNNGNGDPNGNGNDEPGSGEVWMEGHTFNSSTLTVEVGTTVTWTNQTNEIHTVTSGVDGQHDGEFDSGNLSPGDTYTYTFDEVGEYDYYCIPHVDIGMTGLIIVTEDGENSTSGTDGNDGDDGGY